MEFDILNLLLILSAAWLGGWLAGKLGYPSILGELAVGIVFGPALFGFLQSSEVALVLAEMGVLLMMLFIGMEIDYRELGKASWAGALAAIGGFIVPFGLGYYAVIYFGGDVLAGLFTGIAVGVTSLATKSRILVDLKLLNTRIANVLMAGALISDTLALLIFAGILSFADVGNVDFIQISIVAGKAIGFFLISGIIGLAVLPRLGKKLEKLNLGSRSLYFTIMLAVALSFSELAELAGLHHILGAFVAGLFLRDTFPNKRLNKNLTETFHDISIGFLAPIFFVTAGFEVTFDVVFEEPIKLIVILALATLGKIFGTALFYLPSGHGWREGITVGSGMNGRGAVEIIIAGLALRAGYIDDSLFSILVFMAIFTTATVPVLLGITSEWLRRKGQLVMSSDRKQGYIFLGAGPLAEFLATKLSKSQTVTLIDSNKDNCKRVSRAGLNVINGNAMNEEVLAEANISDVKGFVSMTANSEINIVTAQLAQERFLVPDIHVMLSPETEDSLLKLIDLMGASSLFAFRTELEKWDHKFSAGEYKEYSIEIEKEQSMRSVLKMLREEHKTDVLPLFQIKPGNTPLNLVHYTSKLEAGDVITYVI